MLTPTFSAVILASFLGCSVTPTDIMVIARYKKWGTDNAVYFISFAAGALVYVGASHLLPVVERENNKYTLLSMAVGILAAIIIVLPKG